MWNRNSKNLVNLKGKYEFLKDPRETDLVIALMGRTGVGKSTFTNSLLGKERAKVGHTTKSATSKVEYYEYSHPQHPGRRILIVDTPGFDDRSLSETEILERIAFWLAESYANGMGLAGLIYIFNITSERVTASEARSYGIFEALCGKGGASKVVLATSKWDKLKDIAEGEEREKELQDEFWQDMFQRGSTMHRLRRSRELEGGSKAESPEVSARKVIDSILSQSFVGGVEIQRDLVDKRKDLTKTEAWKTAAKKDKEGKGGLRQWGEETWRKITNKP